MKKWLLCIFCSLSFMLEAEISFDQNELIKIEQEIQALKEIEHQIHLQELKEDVKGQGLMIADWEGYAHELEHIREQEKEDNQIELKIKKLEERKAQLLKQKQQID